MLTLKDPSLLKSDAYVDGAWLSADKGTRFAVTNPATGETIAEVADLAEAETVRAIEAAAPRLSGVAQEDGEGARRSSCANGSISSWRTRKTSPS